MTEIEHGNCTDKYRIKIDNIYFVQIYQKI